MRWRTSAWDLSCGLWAQILTVAKRGADKALLKKLPVFLDSLLPASASGLLTKLLAYEKQVQEEAQEQIDEEKVTELELGRLEGCCRSLRGGHSLGPGSLLEADVFRAKQAEQDACRNGRQDDAKGPMPGGVADLLGRGQDQTRIADP